MYQSVVVSYGPQVHIYTGLPFRKFAYTRYDVPWNLVGYVGRLLRRFFVKSAGGLEMEARPYTVDRENRKIRFSGSQNLRPRREMEL